MVGRPACRQLLPALQTGQRSQAPHLLSSYRHLVGVDESGGTPVLADQPVVGQMQVGAGGLDAAMPGGACIASSAIPPRNWVNHVWRSSWQVAWGQPSPAGTGEDLIQAGPSWGRKCSRPCGR